LQAQNRRDLPQKLKQVSYCSMKSFFGHSVQAAIRDCDLPAF
jgi:hypothetical protein